MRAVASVLQPPSGQVIGTPIRSSSQFTMTTAATAEQVPTMSYTFVFDGRPVRFFTSPIMTSQDQASIKLITLQIRRSSDSAVQAASARQTIASATEIQPQTVDTGFFTAWPSDGVPLVVGTQYTVQLWLLSGSSSKAKTNGDSYPYMFMGLTG